MLNDTKMTELAQAEEMAYFRADICCYSPESYTLEEKKQICNDMISSSKAVLDAIREDFDSQPPGLPRTAPCDGLRGRAGQGRLVVGRPRRRRRPALPRA